MSIGIRQVATALLGIRFGTADIAKRQKAAEAALREMPLMGDLATEEDLRVCAEEIIRISDELFDRYLAGVVAVGDRLSSEAVTALFALELAKGVRAQMDAMGESLVSSCAEKGATALERLPMDEQERILAKSKRRASLSLDQLIDQLGLGRFQ